MHLGATLVIHMCKYKAKLSLAGKCDLINKSVTRQSLGPDVHTAISASMRLPIRLLSNENCLSWDPHLK